MDLEQYVMGGFVLIGLVNGLQFALDKKWDAFVRFMTAVIVGGMFGFFKMYGIPSLEVGLAIGVSSSGIYKIAQVLGVKPTGQPNI